ncbi:hypothetical protein [Solibacillus cecembensis]|uniref:hypothetical protein n=1 Tax=Solibacillus cecembensis TaxID=459347 RepID=UPI003D01EAB6
MPNIKITQIVSATDFIRTKNVLFEIEMRIKLGVLKVASTLIDVGAYSKAIESLGKKSFNSLSYSRNSE